MFAAYAPVAAALYNGTDSTSGCNPGRQIPLVDLHSTGDTIEPFNGQPDNQGKFGSGCRSPRTHLRHAMFH